MKALRVAYDNVNIAAVDYDPGASEVNQLNRIKLMLAVARNIVSTNRWVHEGKWQTAIGVDVCGKPLGLMGFGAMAKNVARRARGFGMQVLAYDPYVKELPQERGKLSGDSHTLVLQAKDRLTELAGLSLEIARMAVTPEDGKELPDWFVVELFRDLPRLADKRNG